MPNFIASQFFPLTVKMTYFPKCNSNEINKITLFTKEKKNQYMKNSSQTEKQFSNKINVFKIIIDNISFCE